MRGWITDSKATSGLRLAEDLPEPEPADDELVLEVKAYGVNRGELVLVDERPDGFRPGQDVAGVVARAAKSGGPNVGARVVALLDWHGWSERVSVNVAHVAVLPDDVSFDSAVTLPVAGVTALRAVRLGGDLTGRNVLVTGAAGGVGQLGVQLSVAAGAHVTALVRERQIEEARALGAHAVVTSLAGDDSRRFDLVLDGVGGPTLVSALHRAKPGAVVAMYGVLEGKAALDIFDFAECPNAKLVGLFLDQPGPHAKDELATLVSLLQAKRLSPAIGLRDDWLRTPEVLSAFRERKVRGKAVLVRA
jgi:NADPH:quinone reductase-like Zn-dependent oxidoreductase